MTMLHRRNFLLFLLASEVLHVFAGSGEIVDLSYVCVTSPRTMDAVGEENVLTPILLLHGVMASKKTWYGIQRILAKQTGRRVCAADARDHGNSPKTDSLSLEYTMADTLQLMDKLNFTKVILIGHSMGGKTAMLVALNHSHRVEKLIVEDMSPQGAPNLMILAAKLLVEFMLESLRTVPEGSTETQAVESVYPFLNDTLSSLGYGSLATRLKAKLEKYLKCSNGTCHFTIDLNLLIRVIEDPGFRGPLVGGPYHGPSFFIYGKESLLNIGAQKDAISKLFPNLEMVEVDGADHDVHEEKPNEFLSAVIKFLEQP